MHPRTAKLKQLKAHYGLTCHDIASLTARSVCSVHNWLSVSDLIVIPVRTLELLEQRIRDKQMRPVRRALDKQSISL